MFTRDALLVLFFNYANAPYFWAGRDVRLIAFRSNEGKSILLKQEKSKTEGYKDAVDQAKSGEHFV